MEKRDISDLAYILSRNQKDPTLPKPIVFLGAGASVSAGIPMASEIVKRILKDFSEKPAIKRLTKENKSDYYQLMSALSADERRDLFMSYINSDDVKINVTHIYLAQLIKEGLIDYVFTPNFDDLLLKACALFNYIPPVYDISNFSDFTTTNFQSGSVTYLHGQHHGQWLLNAQGELEKVKGIIPKLFHRVCDKRTWIVVGYSGNDEVLEELAKFESFDNELYWVGYKNHEPNNKVKEKLLNVPQKNAFLIQGYDSDTFFLQLHSELKLETPEIFNKPFTFIETMMENIKNIEEYESDEEHKEKFDAVNRRFLKSKEMVKNAISTIENETYNKIEQDINDAIVKGDFSKAEVYYDESLQNELLKVNVSKLFNSWGVELSETAEDNSDEELFLKAFEKYKIATELNPKNDLAYYNWGTNLFRFAKFKNDKILFLDSIEKLEKANELDPNNDSTLYNLGTVMSNFAQMELDVNYFKKSLKKFEEASKLDPDNPDVFNNWGTALFQLSKLSFDEKLCDQSIEKFIEIIKMDPKNYFAFRNWGIVLSYLADLKSDKILWLDCIEKLEKAIKLNDIDANSFYDLSGALLNYYHLVEDENLKRETLNKALESSLKTLELGGNTYNLACVYALLGNKENSLKYLRDSLENNFIEVQHVSNDKDWNVYQEDPEFLKILSKY